MLKRFSPNSDSNNKLYLIGTPIGNIKDITFRAIETLKLVDVIYCEDTRITGILLKEFDISKPLKACNVMTENDVTPLLINDLKNGLNVAYVSDAGMPGISDPGYLACKMAKDENICVEVIPGVVAGITAVVASTLPTNHFLFYGFLNSKHSQRIKELNTLASVDNTIIFYEAPHRIKETLEDILEVFGDREICLARELTKRYEEYLHGTISDVLSVVDTIKGEMVIVCEGNNNEEIIDKLNSLSIEEHYTFYLNQSLNPKDAMKAVARDRGISKSVVYQTIKK